MIKSLLKKFLEPESTEASISVELAAAVLLVEVTKADHEIDESEKKELLSAIKRLTSGSETDAQEVFEEAIRLSEEANDLYRFTSIVHQLFTPNQKMDLLIALWRVAYANQVIDKYEEHSIRRIAELLYMPHSDFIRSKILARESSI